jgi:DNA-directed RNA polymerase subunit L
MNKTQTKISLDVDSKELERLKVIAKTEDRSLGSLIRQIIHKFLKGK